MTLSLKEQMIGWRLSRLVQSNREPKFRGQWSKDERSSFHRVYSVSPLYGVELLPSVECERRWNQNRELDWPDVCCVCGEPAERQLDYKGLWSRWPGSRRTVVRGIPHCKHHYSMANGNALLHAETDGFDNQEASLYAFRVYSVSALFLERLVGQVESSWMLPPWQAFHWDHPWDQSSRQGLQEEYVSAWFAMFNGLDESDQLTYITAVNAPKVWQQWARNEEVDATGFVP